jgi:hypothetical protein
MNDTTAVKSRKRVLDNMTFHSSHADCYARDLHAKTPQGREMCRTGQGFSGIQAKPVELMNVKSKISHVVHAAGDTANTTLCDRNIAGAVEVPAADFPVTCKSCIRKSA